MAMASASRSWAGDDPGSRSTMAVPTAPRADRASSVLTTNTAGPVSRTRGAISNSTKSETGMLMLLARVCATESAITAKLIHSNGVIDRRDQPRAVCQCRMIRVSTVAVIIMEGSTDHASKALSIELEPSTSSRLAGQPGPHPLALGFQNSKETTLWPVFHV